MASLRAAVGFDLVELLGPPVIYGSLPGENIYAGGSSPHDDAVAAHAEATRAVGASRRGGVAGAAAVSAPDAAAKEDNSLKQATASAASAASAKSSAAPSCATPMSMRPPTGAARASPPPTGAAHARARETAGGGTSSSRKWIPAMNEQVMVLGQKKGEPFRKKDVATVVQTNGNGTFDLVYVIGPQQLKGMKKNEDFEKYRPRHGRTRSRARPSP
jgi:hypothetical protein